MVAHAGQYSSHICDAQSLFRTAPDVAASPAYTSTPALPVRPRRRAELEVSIAQFNATTATALGVLAPTLRLLNLHRATAPRPAAFATLADVGPWPVLTSLAVPLIGAVPGPSVAALCVLVRQARRDGAFPALECVTTASRVRQHRPIPVPELTVALRVRRVTISVLLRLHDFPSRELTAGCWGAHTRMRRRKPESASASCDRGYA